MRNGGVAKKVEPAPQAARTRAIFCGDEESSRFECVLQYDRTS